MCLMNCAHGAKMNVEPITRMHNGVPICIMRMVATVTGGVELCWDYMAFCDKKEEEMLCACGCGGMFVQLKEAEEAGRRRVKQRL